MTMKLLAILSHEDTGYQHRLPRLVPTVQFSVANTHPATAASVTILAHNANAHGVVCTSTTVLKLLLNALPDYIPPQTRRDITLEDYAGSIIKSPSVGPIKGVEVLVLSPLQQLVTTTTGEHLAKRYLSKLCNKDAWLPDQQFTWSLLESAAQGEEILSRMQDAILISIDIETPGDANRSMTCSGYCALYKDFSTETVVIPCKELWHLDFIARFNALPAAKVFQNGQYDCSYFLRWNVVPTNYRFDTMNLFHSWYSEFPKRLDFIASYTLRNIRYWKDDGQTGDIRDHYRYNARDAWATLWSCISILREMPEYACTNYLIEFPKVFPCFHSSMEGLAVKLDKLNTVRAEAEANAEKLLARIQYILAAPEFNPSSPQQMSKLFTALHVGHLPDTAAASMLKAREYSPLNDLILGLIVEYKKSRKLISTYYEESKFWNGRLLYALNPAGTDTGRLASKESAFWCGLQIQNIPRGDAVKKLIYADPGYRLAELDKKASESRCSGYLSGEEKLINILESEYDFHSKNCEAFFGIPYEEIWDVQKNKQKNKEIRDLGKRTNHGATYCMGAQVMLDTMGPKMVFKAKKLLKLPSDYSLLKVCETLLASFGRAYPKIPNLWYGSLVTRIRTYGVLESPMGWTRKFFGKPWEVKAHRNAAVAHEPQNLSVALINEEFYNVWRSSVYGHYFTFSNLKAAYQFNGGDIPIRKDVDLRGKIRLKAQIHDSILFQYKPEIEAEVIETVLSIMTTPIDVRGADGKVRTMLIPSDAAYGEESWSGIK